MGKRTNTMDLEGDSHPMLRRHRTMSSESYDIDLCSQSASFSSQETNPRKQKKVRFRKVSFLGDVQVFSIPSSPELKQREPTSLEEVREMELILDALEKSAEHPED